ncbi:glycosyltransferase, partial [Candidatus Pelagibacter ubique]|nr:glycosyltransferase [Candidatus Pelagibacter ubique]
MLKKLKELPMVSVIIPTYNDWGRLRKCLLALSNQTYPKNKFEIIVINNNPNDTIPHYIKKYNCTILKEVARGSYAARNTGISFSKGDVLAFTDSDCIPNTFWIERAINRFIKGCDRIAGFIDIFPMNVNANIPELYDITFGFDQEAAASNGLSVTANMFAKKSLFIKYGKFNSSLFSGGDTEWSRRVYSKGISIEFASEVIVKHPARKSLKELFNKRYRVSSKKTIIYPKRLKRNSISKYTILKKRLRSLFFN